MTTVVWDGAVLAADSQEADDYIEQHASQKLFKVGNTLIGIAGCVSSARAFIEWVKKGEPEDEKPKVSGLIALVIRPNGRAFEYGETLTPIPAAKKTAIGSGRGPALGALLAGATADEAVRITKKIDPNTGGRIRKLKLNGA